MRNRILMTYRKLVAIIDIIRDNKFYLITFDENDEPKWRTEYNIIIDEIHEKI